MIVRLCYLLCQLIVVWIMAFCSLLTFSYLFYLFTYLQQTVLHTQSDCLLSGCVYVWWRMIQNNIYSAVFVILVNHQKNWKTTVLYYMIIRVTDRYKKSLSPMMFDRQLFIWWFSLILMFDIIDHYIKRQIIEIHWSSVCCKIKELLKDFCLYCCLFDCQTKLYFPLPSFCVAPTKHWSTKF